MFIEFLTYNGVKHVSTLNYVSAIRSQLKWFEVSTDVLDHVKVKLMLKAVAGTIRDHPKVKGIFDIPTLVSIHTCNLLPHPLVFKAIYLLSCFSFLRISNVLPPSPLTFGLT